MFRLGRRLLEPAELLRIATGEGAHQQGRTAQVDALHFGCADQLQRFAPRTFEPATAIPE